MSLQFFNTFSGKLEEFKPLTPGEVKMYTCGPTVYDYAHIGNFRAFVFEDLLRRFLEYKGFNVKHVMNITDVDDKTIAGANRDVGARSPRPEGGETPPLHRLQIFTEKYIQAFCEDLKTLNILPPNHPATPPRATQEIPAMITLIEQLMKKGAAYMSEGSVYYRVASFPKYGKLSKKKLEGNIKGARVDVDEYDKEEGADFVLWKKAKESEPSWDSPWGKGRPGWHIECSAMSMKYLGETFDIHAGGEDLIFPHHENEIAQSEAATNKPFVRTWLHCKFLLVNGEKMSKSKGNFYTLRDLIAKGHDPMAIRYALLSVHYRKQLNFTEELLKEARETVKKLDDCFWQCVSRHQFQNQSDYSASYDETILEQCLEDILKWLGGDLNISAALAELLETVSDINSRLLRMNREALQKNIEFFKKVDQLFGIDIATDSSIPIEITDILSQREAARKNPDFKTVKLLQSKSDGLRQEIETKNWLVKDARPGEPSTVKKKRRAWDK